MTTAHTDIHAHGDGHGSHPPHLAHHFDTPQQQFESGKLGMWVFLATEILMFGGLFCAYSVYRANHPEVFLYAHHYLDTFWGAFNTVVLLVSSFTMAWAVRAAQLGQKSLCVLMLALTLAGAGGFMVVKAIEYSAKFSHDLAPGQWNVFQQRGQWAEEVPHLEGEYQHKLGGVHTAAGSHGGEAGHDAPAGHAQAPQLEEGMSVGEAIQHATAGSQHAETTGPQTAGIPADHSMIALAPTGPAGMIDSVLDKEVPHADTHHGVYSFDELPPSEKERVHIFFNIYFMMTGLHGIHVLIGMGLIIWILIRAMRGHFGPEYFSPVDITGLYWHLVDLIWIFLFPLLYLIH